MRAKFLPVHDGIIRAVYPVLGSRGVIEILPQFKTKQVNMRAYSLGVKVENGGQQKRALARQTGDASGDIQAPDRQFSHHIYPNAVEHLAYVGRWA